ncbi:MAG: ATP-binding protein, partial [candidate division KSB1 bacterium]|nr:ATP-binding protein [candidate division KSB1 bacterium]
VAFIAHDNISFRRAMIRDLNTLAEIIGENSTAALSFDHEMDAKQTLAALKLQPHIVFACIYAKDGRVFAKYLREDTKVDFSPPQPQPDGYRFEKVHLALFRQIVLNGERIGTVYIQADLQEMQSRLKQYAGIAIIFVLLSSLIVFLITSKLQQIISGPILHLAQVARDVSVRKDYSIRALKQGQDELGFLTERFNEMLSQIQDRDAALQKTHDELKRRAQELQKELTERKRAEEQLKASLREKEVLLKEIHHRVKNNLQIISSLIYLQSKNIQDKEVLQMFQESQNRVKSMALIHEKLYKSKDLARIDCAEYIKSLVTHLFHSYRVHSNAIKLEIDVDDIPLSIDTAIHCGMIINELVSNSLKHAFPSGKAGEIRIKARSGNDNKFTLIVSDDGVGFPKDLDFQNTKSLGLQLVCNLTNQLGGSIELDTSRGTLFKINFSDLK